MCVRLLMHVSREINLLHFAKRLLDALTAWQRIRNVLIMNSSPCAVAKTAWKAWYPRALMLMKHATARKVWKVLSVFIILSMLASSVMYAFS